MCFELRQVLLRGCLESLVILLSSSDTSSGNQISGTVTVEVYRR